MILIRLGMVKMEKTKVDGSERIFRHGVRRYGF